MSPAQAVFLRLPVGIPSTGRQPIDSGKAANMTELKTCACGGEPILLENAVIVTCGNRDCLRMVRAENLVACAAMWNAMPGQLEPEEFQAG